MKDLAIETLTTVPPSILMLGGFLSVVVWGGMRVAMMLQASIG